MLILILILFLIVMFLNITVDKFDNKIPCKKWEGDLRISPDNICKDCGYPIDCHGPYVGDSWRHIFREVYI